MNNGRPNLWQKSAAVVVIFILAACSGGPNGDPASQPAVTDEPPIAQTVDPLSGLPETGAGESDSPAATLPPTESVPAAPTAGAETQPPETEIQPAPAGDLARITYPAPVQAGGEPIIVTGQVLDTLGNPIPGAVVEFWQTDFQGIYDHPGDPGTQNRDQNFQFYGTSTVDEQGYYSFRTILPAEYGSRPPHIHVKVKQNGTELLTTQFYFEQNRASVQNEGIFAQAGAQGDLLILSLEETTDANGTPVQVAAKDLVIDLGGGGDRIPTPRQAEGPYYPVVDFSSFDNDLANTR